MQVILIEPNTEVAEIFNDAIHAMKPAAVVIILQTEELLNSSITDPPPIILQNKGTVVQHADSVIIDLGTHRFLYAIEDILDWKHHSDVIFTLSKPVSVLQIQKALVTILHR